MEEHDQEQVRERRSYENSPWINVYDWQVTEHANGETGKKFWGVKLASNTLIEVDGQKTDVGHYHFTTNVEPAVTYGEPGTPRCSRGIHFPEDWDITLRRFESTAPEGQTPLFKEVGRVEDATPQQLSDGISERAEAWRSANRKASREQAPDRAAQEQKAPGRACMRGDRQSRLCSLRACACRFTCSSS